MSDANADWNVNTHTADHAINLAPEGHTQARGAGTFLGKWFFDHLAQLYSPADDHFPTPIYQIPAIRIWHSPNKRTRQTAAAIEETCVLPNIEDAPKTKFHVPEEGRHDTINHAVRKDGDSWFIDKKEHLLLYEQQFGLFDGLSDEERKEQYPMEFAYYEKCKKFQGKMWAKMPLGESRADVCQRMHQTFGTFRDDQNKGIQNIVVVGHGTTNRAFIQMWMNYPWEWIEKEPNPKNCSIRLLEDGVDKGYIFEGYDNPEGYKHTANTETEE